MKRAVQALINSKEENGCSLRLHAVYVGEFELHVHAYVIFYKGFYRSRAALGCCPGGIKRLLQKDLYLLMGKNLLSRQKESTLLLLFQRCLQRVMLGDLLETYRIMNTIDKNQPRSLLQRRHSIKVQEVSPSSSPSLIPS